MRVVKNDPQDRRDHLFRVFKLHRAPPVDKSYWERLMLRSLIHREQSQSARVSRR